MKVSFTIPRGMRGLIDDWILGELARLGGGRDLEPISRSEVVRRALEGFLETPRALLLQAPPREGSGPQHEICTFVIPLSTLTKLDRYVEHESRRIDGKVNRSMVMREAIPWFLDENPRRIPKQPIQAHRDRRGRRRAF